MAESTGDFVRAYRDTQTEEEHLRAMQDMMFSQKKKVPDLKPLTKIRPCDTVHPCKHRCGGCKGEKECPPCLHEDCREADQVNMNDNCNICSSALSD